MFYNVGLFIGKISRRYFMLRYPKSALSSKRPPDLKRLFVEKSFYAKQENLFMEEIREETEVFSEASKLSLLQKTRKSF